MAVSGSEQTRIGASLAGVGKRLSITAKSPSAAPSFLAAYAINANTTIGAGPR